jgi:hypothetical protein
MPSTFSANFGCHCTTINDNLQIAEAQEALSQNFKWSSVNILTVLRISSLTRGLILSVQEKSSSEVTEK